jgi:magnesium chelatase subunit H
LLSTRLSSSVVSVSSLSLLLLFSFILTISILLVIRMIFFLPFTSCFLQLLFECATELMEFNQVGSFNMKPGKEGPSGPPPAVKAILSKFGSGKEEDKLSGYIKLLKFGPDLLKFVPGEKASDLRSWLECYRYWNQGGRQNVKAMLNLVADLCLEASAVAAAKSSSNNDDALVSNKRKELPPVQITPDIGLIHPVRQAQLGGVNSYFDSPASYLSWRRSQEAKDAARQQRFLLAADDAPVVAVLLYRKHVISELSYVNDLLRIMEQQGIIPVPIFINGVEAHTIVRDLLTSQDEIRQVERGVVQRAKTFQARKAGKVDAIVNTIGFPLVGGPAGSMEAGRNVAVAEELLSAMNGKNASWNLCSPQRCRFSATHLTLALSFFIYIT